jgi:hypothetical protein
MTTTRKYKGLLLRMPAHLWAKLYELHKEGDKNLQGVIKRLIKEAKP